jgi:hypothetical protein
MRMMMMMRRRSSGVNKTGTGSKRRIVNKKRWNTKSESR